MKNEKKYEQVLNEAGVIRYGLDEQLHPKMRAMLKLFKLRFGEKPKYLKIAKDLQYYTGGYPKPESPAKIHSLMAAVGKAYVIMMMEGRGKESKFNDELAEYGLEIRVKEGCIPTAPYSDHVMRKPDKFNKLWEATFEGDDAPADKEGVLKKLFSEMIELQKEICAEADKIKIEKAEAVEKECEVKKSPFIKAVKLKCKEIKGAEVAEALQKIEERHKELEEAVSPLAK